MYPQEQIIIDSINVSDFVISYDIDRPEIRNGLAKSSITLHNPGGRFNTIAATGNVVEIKLGWVSTTTVFKGKIYDRNTPEGDMLEIFVGQLGWNAMLYQSDDEILTDYEVSDIIKHMLIGTSITTTNVQFGSGVEHTITDFHIDTFPSNDTVEETSNVTHIVAGNPNPSDYDAWTEDPEDEMSDYGTEQDTWTKVWTGNLYDEAPIHQVGSYSKKFITTSTSLNALYRYDLPSSDYFYWGRFKRMKIYIYKYNSNIDDDFYLRFSATFSQDSASSKVKHITIDISAQSTGTWQEYTIDREHFSGIYLDIKDNEQVKWIFVGIGTGCAIGSLLYFDGLDIVLDDWQAADSSGILTKDTGIKEQGTASIKNTHRSIHFEDDFNADDDDSVPDNWTISSSGADYWAKVCSYWTSRNNYGDLGIVDGDRSLNIYDLNTSNQVALYKALATGVTGSGIIRFSIRADRNSGEEGLTTVYIKDNNDYNEIGFRLKHDYANNETDMEYEDSGGWHVLNSISGAQWIQVLIEYNETAATYDLTIWCNGSVRQTVTSKAFITNGTGLKKIQLQTETSLKSRSCFDCLFWGTESGGGNQNREIIYPATKDKALDCENTYANITFHIRQNVTDNDPVLRLYTSAGNYFYQTINITGADAFQEFTLDVGSSSSGWSEQGTPDWSGINWIGFYWTSSQTTVTATYIDKLYLQDATDSFYRLKTSTPDFTDDDTVDFDGTLTQMINDNNKLEMYWHDLISQTSHSSDAAIGGYDDGCYFKAMDNTLTHIHVKVRNKAGSTTWTYYWRLGDTMGSSEYGSGSFTVPPATNTWKTVTFSPPVTLVPNTWYYFTMHSDNGTDCRLYYQESDVNANMQHIRSGVKPAEDTAFKATFLYEDGNYVSDVKDGGASTVWCSMDINSNLDGATIKLYTYSNDTGTLGTPTWSLRATLTGGNQTDIDISAETGRYLWYKVDVESGATGSTWIDDIDGYKGSYSTSGYLITYALLTDEFEYFNQVKIDFVSTEPGGSDIVAKAANDNGTTWETCTDDVWKTLTDHHSSAENHGRMLKIKIEFSGDGSVTPKLYSISVDVKVIPIVVLAKFERRRETRLRSFQRLVDINNSDCYINNTPDCNFFPQGTKASGQTLNRQKGVWNFQEGVDEQSFRNKVYLHGALDATYPLVSDDWCEGDAASWTGTSVAVSDDTNHYKINSKSIKGVITPSGGWSDDCGDGTISATNFDQKKTGSATLTEANGYIRCYTSPYVSNVAFLYYEDSAYELVGNYEILFDVRTDDSLLESLICGLVTGAPIYNSKSWLDKNIDYIKFDAPRKIVLRVPNGSGGYTQTTLMDNVSKNTWYHFKIKRASTTHTIYINGEQVWSGTLYDSDHTNIQFGDFRTNEGEEGINTDYDNFVWKTATSGGNLLAPSFNKNLDLFNAVKLWYSQNTLDVMQIRLETTASDYFSWNITPTLINEFFEIEIPVGSTSSGWSSTGSPDWQQILNIRFVFGSVATTYFNIDELHFKSKEIIISSELTTGTYGTATYGEKALRIYDRTVVDIDFGKQIVKTLREKIDDPIDIIRLTTILNTVLLPGDSVTVNLPDRSINAMYYVCSLIYKNGHQMDLILNNNEITLEHMLLGFETDDQIIAEGTVSANAPEISAD